MGFRSEGSGQAFGAQFSGKLKMVFQSVTILVILVYVNYFAGLGGRGETAMRIFRDVCIWATLFITVWSGIMYIRWSIQLAAKKRRAAEPVELHV